MNLIQWIIYYLNSIISQNDTVSKSSQKWYFHIYIPNLCDFNCKCNLKIIWTVTINYEFTVNNCYIKTIDILKIDYVKYILTTKLIRPRVKNLAKTFQLQTFNYLLLFTDVC